MNTLALLTNNPQTTYEKRHKKLEKDHVTLTMPTWGMGPGYSLYTANQLTEFEVSSFSHFADTSGGAEL